MAFSILQSQLPPIPNPSLLPHRADPLQIAGFIPTISTSSPRHRIRVKREKGLGKSDGKTNNSAFSIFNSQLSLFLLDIFRISKILAFCIKMQKENQ